MRVFVILLSLCCMICLIGAKKISSISAKNKKTKSFSFFQNNPIIKNLVREAKISFSSELEGLTLKLTKPNEESIPLSLLENIISFTNLEHDNPPFIVGLLAKLSRKYSDLNIFSQIKVALSIHKVILGVEDEKAKKAWSAAFYSLKAEKDEKAGTTFFSLDLLDDAKTFLSSSLEKESWKFAQLYIPYVFENLVYHTNYSSNSISKSKVKTITPKDRLIKLSSDVKELISITKKFNTPLINQCIEALKEEKEWLEQELLKVSKSQPQLQDELETSEQKEKDSQKEGNTKEELHVSPSKVKEGPKIVELKRNLEPTNLDSSKNLPSTKRSNKELPNIMKNSIQKSMKISYSHSSSSLPLNEPSKASKPITSKKSSPKKNSKSNSKSNSKNSTK